VVLAVGAAVLALGAALAEDVAGTGLGADATGTVPALAGGGLLPPHATKDNSSAAPETRSRSAQSIIPNVCVILMFRSCCILTIHLEANHPTSCGKLHDL
jgi:hypothetical protein